jgi:hypothetical protein
MKGDKIKYKDGYKHQLVEDYQVNVSIIPDKFPVDTPFLKLDMQGNLLIKAGYAWDGASGPTYDTSSCKRGSLVHDALYQLMREEKISLKCRDKADDLLRDICIEDGMYSWRAKLWHLAVNKFGLCVATVEGEREVIIAP